MKRIAPRTSAQSGQAMAEFLISMTLVMSVLLLGIAMLGKFNDVRNRTLMGSRYIAWERTVWTDTVPKKGFISDPSTTEGWSSSYGSAALAAHKMDEELKSEVIQRVMAGDRSPVSGTDRKYGPSLGSRPAMWDDYGGNPLLASTADVVATTTASENPASSNARAAVTPFGTISTGTGGTYLSKLDLPTRTLQSGTLSISIARDSDVLKRLWPKDHLLPAFSGLTFSDTNVLMANAWVADGSDNAKAVFSQAVPAANVVLVQPYGYLGLQKYAPEISSLQFGLIQQDVVPANRLSQ